MHWRMTNILLRLSWCLPQEVKRIEVICHLMYADFPCACFYTLERGIRVKALYQQGAYHEATPEYKRMAFVRWLYQQGRLQS